MTDYDEDTYSDLEELGEGQQRLTIMAGIDVEIDDQGQMTTTSVIVEIEIDSPILSRQPTSQFQETHA